MRTCREPADAERRFQNLKGRGIRVRPIRHCGERRVRAPFPSLACRPGTWSGIFARPGHRPFDDGIPAEARRTRAPVIPAEPTGFATPISG